jgi:hypothetical protein
MKLKEIIVYPDRNGDLEKYQNFFLNSHKRPAFHSLEYSRVNDTDDDKLGLFNKETLVSILHLNIRDEIFWQITYTETDEKFQGQGCFRYLINQAVKAHGEILSDTHQTPKSKIAWQSLIKHPGPELNIYVYDVERKIKQPAYEILDNQIWNNKSNPVLMVTKTSYNQNNVRESVMKKLMDQVGIDRTDNGIWYGPGTSNHDYFNP